MIFRVSLLVLAAAIRANTFQIPADLADGTYVVSLDSSTIQSVPLLTDQQSGSPDVAVQPRQGTAPALPSTQTTCPNVALTSRADFDAVRQLFETYCDTYRTYNNNTAVIIRDNSAIAYICVYTPNTRCWRSEYEEASGIMDKSCGSGNAAVVYVPQYSKSYGRDNWNANICQR
jgi:hypothetical protein